MSKHHGANHHKKPRLKIVLPTGEAYKCKVTGEVSHIGSGARSDIQIADPNVSTAHAVLDSIGNDYFIVDQGGRKGTFVNGERVTRPRKLSHGDVIKLGNSQITFTLKDGAEALEAGLNNGAREEKEKKHKKHKEDKHKEKPHKQSGSVAAPKSPSDDKGSEAERRKKARKKAREKVDERVKAARVRAWGGIIATVLSVVLTVTISILVTRMGSQPTGALALGGSQSSMKLAGLSDSNDISGETYEASGAVAVPDESAILFVDDSRPDHVFYMPINGLGEQDGPVEAIPLGAAVENPEGISQFGSRFMITGALSTHESNEQGGVVAFDFDPATRTVSKAVALTGMRKFLFDNVPELKAWANKMGIEGGLNIEGIAVDPNPEHPRVLLGLRGPVLNGNALVVPIRLRDRLAPLSLENLEMDEPNAIQLNLNGQAIRDIQYDSRLRSFLIISGAPETAEKTDFTLWAWSGEGNQSREEARPKKLALLDKKMKPEGVTHLKVADQEFVFLVGDASRYAKIDYVSP